MPVFSYQALNRSGAEVSGTVNANDARAALAQVQELGLHPLEVRPGGAAPAADDSLRRRRGRRVSAADLTLFTRQLANLVRGGLPMMRTLDALIDNTDNARLHAILSEVRAAVAGGDSLHLALAQHPKLFSPLYLSLVAAGEVSGDLAGVLARLADFLEQDLERRSQIRAALMYPTLLVSVGTLIVFALVTFLIPRFKVLFEEFDRALPLVTQLVLALSGFLGQWWWGLLLAAVVLFLVHRQWLKTEHGRVTWDRWKLRWPVVGKLNHRAATARLARTLATLLHGGVSILDALHNVEGVLDNAYLASVLRQIRDGVREGESLGLETRRTGEFPSLLSQMMLVGEETGDVEGALNTVSDALDVEVANALRGLVALVEPVIILLMGVAVAVVVFAMLMPIFQMNAGIA